MAYLARHAGLDHPNRRTLPETQRGPDGRPVARRSAGKGGDQVTDELFMTILGHIGVVLLILSAFCAWLHVKAVS